MPKVIQRQMANRRVKPRSHTRVDFPCRARSPDGEKHVLDQLLCYVPRANVSISEAPQLVVVSQIKQLECGLVSAANTRDEIRFFIVYWGGSLIHSRAIRKARRENLEGGLRT